jgi:ubiquinone/menaquinone biosynthesis C-methylase UbiE
MIVSIFIFCFKWYNIYMFSNPEKNINQFGISEGMRVADFGAGVGFYTKILSEKVGNSGKVYAVEVQKDLAKKLESEIKELNISNISVIWGDIERIDGTKIADNSLDAVLISNVLFQIEDIFGLVDETKRVLKEGGRVLLIDLNHNKDYSVDKDYVLGIFLKKGFSHVKDIEVSQNHYGIIFKS